MILARNNLVVERHGSQEAKRFDIRSPLVVIQGTLMAQIYISDILCPYALPP